jgi:hypothetical protein
LSGARAGKKHQLKRRRPRNGKARVTNRKPGLQGLLKAGTKISKVYKGKEYTATIGADGTIELNGKTFVSPSLAGYEIVHRPVNGWWFWRYQANDGKWVRLDRLRK